MLIQLKQGLSPVFFGSSHPCYGDWMPGVPRDVADSDAHLLMSMDMFEHVHDERCNHLQDETSEPVEVVEFASVDNSENQEGL